MAFRGTYDHSLDAKNRLTVPAKFRAPLADGVVLARGLKRCVGIWQPHVFEAYVQTALDSFPPLSPQAETLNEFFAAGSFDTELDAAGRIMVPKRLMEHGDLRKEVVVNGMGNRLEIWDSGAWSRRDETLLDEVTQITASLGHAR